MAKSWPISCLLNSKTDAIDYCLLQSRNNLWLVCPLLSSPYASVCVCVWGHYVLSTPALNDPLKSQSLFIRLRVLLSTEAALKTDPLIILSVLFFFCFPPPHIHCTCTTFPIPFSVQIHLFSHFIITLLCPSHPPFVLHVNLTHTCRIRSLNNWIKVSWIMTLLYIVFCRAAL